MHTGLFLMVSMERPEIYGHPESVLFFTLVLSVSGGWKQVRYLLSLRHASQAEPTSSRW